MAAFKKLQLSTRRVLFAQLGILAGVMIIVLALLIVLALPHFNSCEAKDSGTKEKCNVGAVAGWILAIIAIIFIFIAAMSYLIYREVSKEKKEIAAWQKTIKQRRFKKQRDKQFYIEVLPRNSDAFKEIYQLVRKTWDAVMSDGESGNSRDGVNLYHNKLRIKQIYEITNKTLLDKYNACLRKDTAVEIDHVQNNVDKQDDGSGENWIFSNPTISTSPDRTQSDTSVPGRKKDSANLCGVEEISGTPTKSEGLKDPYMTEETSREAEDTSNKSHCNDEINTGPETRTKTKETDNVPNNPEERSNYQSSIEGKPMPNIAEPTNKGDLAKPEVESETVGEPYPDSASYQFGQNLKSLLFKNSCQRSESYLFHGCLPDEVTDVVMHGFDPTKRAPGPYGSVVSLFESSEKADQLSDKKFSREDSDLLMILVRSTLGRIYENKDSPQLQVPCEDEACDAINCDHPLKFESAITGFANSFRQILVYDPDRCYPHYVILYDRTYQRNIVSTQL